MTKAIISYDDTANDRDALALGRVLADAGAEPTLAYVRHTKESEHRREELQEHEARALLARGAELLGDRDVKREVVLSASTGEGLWALAERESAGIVVFGSDYRTASGVVRPGTSAARLLDGGPAAVAIAPAGLHDRAELAVTHIGVLPEQGDATAAETASNLARALGAEVASTGVMPVDLLVVGSRPEAAAGRVRISAVAEYAIETTGVPVLVVPRDVALPFGTSTGEFATA